MHTIKYNWKYAYDETKVPLPFEIVPIHKPQIPSTLFKLYALTKYSIDSLTNCKVYAAHPGQFNDLFDCYEGLIEFDDENVIFKFMSVCYSITEIIKMLDTNRDSVIRRVQSTFREILYRKWGVLSLTNNPNSILMWGYYTDNKGFAVEYNYSLFPFNYHGPFPINYQNKIEPIKISQTGIPLSILYQTNIKTNDWDHEDEWRILIESPKDHDMVSPCYEDLKHLGGHDRNFQYPVEAIKSVSLANRFFDTGELRILRDDVLEINLKSNIENKALILNFLSENKILTYGAIRNDSEFKLIFKPSRVEKINDIVFRLNSEF